MKPKRSEAVANMAAPGTAAGVVLKWLTKHPKLRVFDVGAVAGATGLPPKRVEWGFHVLRALGRLPADMALAQSLGGPFRNLPVAATPDATTTAPRVAPPAPAAPSRSSPHAVAKDPEFAARGWEARRQAPSALDAAAAWLLAELAARPLRARDVRARGAAAGHTWRTLQRARVVAGVEARQRGGAPGVWRLPCHPPFSVSWVAGEYSWTPR